MQNMYSTHFDRIDISTNKPILNDAGGEDLVEAERPASFWQSIFARGGYYSANQMAPINQVRHPLGGKISQSDSNISTSAEEAGGGNMADSEADYQEELNL